MDYRRVRIYIVLHFCRGAPNQVCLSQLPRLISANSHALASRQSRMTASGETFKTSAVSSTLNPPKKRNSIARALRASISSSALSASSRAISSQARAERTSIDARKLAAPFVRPALARYLTVLLNFFDELRRRAPVRAN